MADVKILKSKLHQTSCPVTGDKDLPTFPMPRECPFDPPPAYKQLREEQPVTRVKLWNGDQPWLITRYEDLRQALTDPHFSSDSDRPGFPGQSKGVNVARQRYRTFVSMDPPQHTAHRRMLTGEFSIKRIEAMRPKIQKIVDDLIDAMLQKSTPVDLVEEFALPLPSLVICDLLGVPYEDHDFFQTRAKIILSDKSTTEEATKAAYELCDEYIGSLLKKKEKDPQDDLLSRLVVNHVRTGDLTDHQAISIARQLLVAGHETTANTTTMGTLLLLEHPAQLEKLKCNLALVNNAVEEILRYIDVTHAGRRRVATADVMVGNQCIRAGEGIIAANPSANRDPVAFPDPDTFDIERDVRHHVAFGYGVHQCLGQPLARVELQVIFGTLFKRIPTLRLAVPLSEIEFKNDMFVYGAEKVMVAW